MSVISEIDRIKSNISSAYTKASEKGATMPAVLDSQNLPSTIESIQNITPVPININGFYTVTNQPIGSGYEMYYFLIDNENLYTGFSSGLIQNWTFENNILTIITPDITLSLTYDENAKTFTGVLGDVQIELIWSLTNVDISPLLNLGLDGEWMSESDESDSILINNGNVSCGGINGTYEFVQNVVNCCFIIDGIVYYYVLLPLESSGTTKISFLGGTYVKQQPDESAYIQYDNFDLLMNGKYGYFSTETCNQLMQGNYSMEGN